MLLFDMLSCFILPARCHNHNTSSVSQVVVILLSSRDVGDRDVPMRTCHCHMLFLTNRCASKICLVRGAERVMMFVGVRCTRGVVWFSHLARCEGDCAQRRTTQYGSHVTKTLARNSWFGEVVLGATRRPIMRGALWSASCGNLPCSLHLDGAGVLAPACALSYTQ